MNTPLLFRRLCVCVAILFVSGCATGNFVSSDNFQIYVSEKRYLNESCSTLGKMYNSLQTSNRSYYARMFIGLDVYPHPIAPRHERQLIHSNLNAIVVAIKQKC